MQAHELPPQQESKSLEATGEVVGLSGARIQVQTERQGGCTSCGANKTCGTSALAQLFSPNTPLLEVENTLDAKLGDKVVLTLDESDLIKHSLMAYGIPLLIMFIVAGLAQVFLAGWFGSDLPVVIAGFLGLGAGWWMTKTCYQPVLPTLTKIIAD